MPSYAFPTQRRSAGRCSLELRHDGCEVRPCLRILQSVHSVCRVLSVLSGEDLLHFAARQRKAQSGLSCKLYLSQKRAAHTCGGKSAPNMHICSTHLVPAALHEIEISVQPFKVGCVLSRQLLSWRHLRPPAVRHKADQLRREGRAGHHATEYMGKCSREALAWMRQQ